MPRPPSTLTLWPTRPSNSIDRARRRISGCSPAPSRLARRYLTLVNTLSAWLASREMRCACRRLAPGPLGWRLGRRLFRLVNAGECGRFAADGRGDDVLAETWAFADDNGPEQCLLLDDQPR